MPTHKRSDYKLSAFSISSKGVLGYEYYYHYHSIEMLRRIWLLVHLSIKMIFKFMVDKT